MDPVTMFAAATAAIIIGQGNHQMDGFRDTGCDPAHQVAVKSDRTGDVLYWNNSTCPAGTGATDSVASAEPAAPEDPENGDNGNGNGASNGSGGPNGNASANNGRGGNYAWTGHADNGQGNGRGRR